VLAKSPVALRRIIRPALRDKTPDWMTLRRSLMKHLLHPVVAATCFTAAIAPLLPSPALGAVSEARVGDCVRHLTRELDRPFRLPVARATARCNAIETRLNALSRRILGHWELRRRDGSRETVDFLPDGTARIRRFTVRMRRWENETRHWQFTNPYGTPGQEVLDFYPYLVGVEFSANAMIVAHQPTSSLNAYTERWTR
jgi:hypothetical protein